MELNELDEWTKTSSNLVFVMQHYEKIRTVATVKNCDANPFTVMKTIVTGITDRACNYSSTSATMIFSSPSSLKRYKEISGQ